MSLEDASHDSGATGEWDQFAVNERKFGVQSDFDESLYTTEIDRNSLLYAQRAAAADRIAREIEKDQRGVTNVHIAEERGITFGDDSGVSEEDKYACCRRPPPIRGIS